MFPTRIATGAPAVPLFWFTEKPLEVLGGQGLGLEPHGVQVAVPECSQWPWDTKPTTVALHKGRDPPPSAFRGRFLWFGSLP